MNIEHTPIPVVETGIVGIVAQLADDKLFLYTDPTKPAVAEIIHDHPQRSVAAFWARQYQDHRKLVLQFLRNEVTVSDVVSALQGRTSIPDRWCFRFSIEGDGDAVTGDVFQSEIRFRHSWRHGSKVFLSCIAVIIEPEWYVDNDTVDWAGLDLKEFLIQLPAFYKSRGRLDQPVTILDEEQLHG